jgi:F-type H+-transporting ATPase subunit delta
MSNPLEDVKQFKKTDVSAERVARVYAEALLQSAGNEADSVGDELVELIQVACKKEPNLYPFLASGTIATKTKSEFFEKYFRGKSSDALVNFLQIVNAHGRLDIIHAIAASYRTLLNEKKKRVPAFVKSAVALDEPQRQALKKQLNDLFHVEPLLEEQVDPELLGGFIVRVGDWQFDGTVKARLNKLKNQLLERSTHEIQGRRDRFCTV